ncbi:MAG: DUF5689 domain-containing protein [Alistipes sp.]|nr:DUF5689 domain-containing protein [Alistipes senegalensis]MCM1251132.1 DUF5689 domain-containing protein [Alistipes sp.]
MRHLALSILAWLSAGCYDSSFDTRTRTDEPEAATTTLGQLRDLFAGRTFVVESDITVKGCVTTSDENENFYRTFCVEADGAGLEIMAGLGHLHNDYPAGCTVAIRLRGRALGESRGVLQLGRMPSAESGYPTDYIASRPALDATITRTAAPLRSVEPTVRTIGELVPAICGTLVRIEGLHYAPEELSEGNWAGYKRFADDEGAAVYTYVRSYARFADNEVPAGRCALTGILQHDGDRYILKLRDEDDCELR